MIPVTVITESARDRHGDPTGITTTVMPAYGFAPGPGAVTEDERSTHGERTGVLFFPPDAGPFAASSVFVFSVSPGAPPTRWGLSDEKQEWVFPWSDWRPGSEVRVRRQSG